MHTTTITSHEGVCTTPSIKSALAVPPSRHTHTYTHQNRRKTDKAPRRPCPAKFEQLCEACNCQNKTKKKHTHTQQPSIPSRKSATNLPHPHLRNTQKKTIRQMSGTCVGALAPRNCRRRHTYQCGQICEAHGAHGVRGAHREKRDRQRKEYAFYNCG